MPKIQVLSQHVANQIAAGEVVERPASVVKELVENSIDAAATSITVEIEDGGTSTIIVTDNGSGIPKDECKTAFLRHATSKISTSAELFSIRTLGFRGEALASIAAVSEVAITTKTANSDLGSRLHIDTGVFGEIEAVASNIGTTIVVKNLFANVPARLKFQKSSRTEAGYIGDYMARAILAHPDIAFRYVSNGKTVYETTGDWSLQNAIFCVYGSEVVNNLLPIAFDNGYIKVDGYIGNLELAKPNRTYQSIYVNGRYIKSTPISFTLSRAYDTRLMGGKFPLAVLKIQIAYQEVDVNVHPAKTEVRFTDEHRVTSCIYAACTNALGQLETMQKTPALVQSDARIPQSTYSPHAPSKTEKFQGGATVVTKNAHSMNEAAYSPLRAKSYYETIDSLRREYQPSSLLPDTEKMRIIGCAFSTYWIVEWESSLYIVDQHAAHERILYEKLTSRAVEFASQQLLYPQELVLSASDFERLQAIKKEMQTFGFAWNDVSNNKIAIKAVPQLNGRALDQRYLYDCIEIFASESKSPSLELCQEKMMQCACKHAVKGGDVLSQGEIYSLLKTFSDNNIPLTCPHGRPVIIRLSKSDLERMFKRTL